MNLLNSTNDFNEAKQVIPGGVNSPVRSFNQVGGVPPFIQRGEGSYIYDEDGNSYIDFVQSWGPLIFGHRDLDIEHSIIKALKNGLSFGAPTRLETKLAKLIISSYDGIEKVRLVSSGTEAVMSAIRLTRGYTGREDIIKFEGCYHGHSDSLLIKAGSGATTFGNPSSLGVPQDFVKHTLLATYNDIESVKKCFASSNNIACVIIEPVAGNMGLVPADKEFLKELRRICDYNNTLLIFDEVMSGFRCAFGGASELYNINPDIVTFGKVIGGGMPVGAFAANAEIMDKLSPNGAVYQAGTLSGNPIAVSAGIASLEKLNADRKIYERLGLLASKLTDGMKKSANKYNIPLQVCVRGSMFGFFFNENLVYNFADALKSDTKMFAKFHEAMLAKGVYFACSQFETGFICTTMDDDLIDSVLFKIDEAFRDIKV